MSDLLLPLAALPFPNIDPVMLRIGSFPVHWYGVSYIVGILFGWWYAKMLCRRPALWGGQPAMKPEDIDDLLLWAALGIVLGGRVGYVLFYDLQRYISDPTEIYRVWHGGMSFHGGMLGTALAMTLFARSRGIRVFSQFDVIAAGTPVALGLVRCANFINGELWGRPTDVPWAIEFPTGGPFTRHPSQLYEAGLEGIVLFAVLAVLVFAFRKLRSPGFITGAFLCGYGLARIFVEFYREPDAQLGYLYGGWLTMGMILSTPMVLIGLWAMMTARRVDAPRPA